MTAKTCVYDGCTRYNLPIVTASETCSHCMCTYPGPDGTLSVKCPHGCLNGRVMEGAMACNVCNRPANPDVLLQSQVTRMQLRGTHTAWRKYVERCARETMPMRWWKGPVTFVQGAEFAMAVAVGWGTD